MLFSAFLANSAAVSSTASPRGACHLPTTRKCLSASETQMLVAVPLDTPDSALTHFWSVRLGTHALTMS